MNTEYWKEHLEKDYENWILYDSTWTDYWIKKSDDIDLLNYENKGFILLNKCDDYGCELHIYFAYVSSKFRRQGVLRKLLDMLYKKYPNKKIYLDSYSAETDKVWSKVGFKMFKETPGNTCNIFTCS